MAYQVLKPIPIDNETIPSGTIVDAADWRNLRALIAGRYLVEVRDEPKPAPVPRARRAPAPAPDPEVTDRVDQ